MSKAVQAEIEKLREELRRHNRLYFVEARPRSAISSSTS